MPLNETVIVGCAVSLLEIVSAPVAPPCTDGVNVRATGADCPAEITFGVAIPLNPNPAPEIVREETVKSEFPAFEIVKLDDPEVLICTLPKFTAVVLREICGVLASALAERFTTTGLLLASPCTVKVPLSDPLVVGVTLNVNVPD